MEFRPCIDIHNGKVKQIVGSSLADEGDRAVENFVAGADAAYYAHLYKEAGLRGGHIILLNSRDSAYYEATKAQALQALAEYPGGLQIGGGIDAANAKQFLDAGASHVIVTSYVFRDGKIDYERLATLRKNVGKEHLVLDLSCAKRADGYYIVTDRWQKDTRERVTTELLERLGSECDEFLVHAVDVEGKANGIERELASCILAVCICTREENEGLQREYSLCRWVSNRGASIPVGTRFCSAKSSVLYLCFRLTRERG